jgi:hypothetical protein
MLWAAAVVQWIERAPPKSRNAIFGFVFISSVSHKELTYWNPYRLVLVWVHPVQPHAGLPPLACHNYRQNNTAFARCLELRSR